MKTRNDCQIACDCVKRANVVLHVGLCEEIFARKHTATHKPTSAQPLSAPYSGQRDILPCMAKKIVTPEVFMRLICSAIMWYRATLTSICIETRDAQLPRVASMSKRSSISHDITWSNCRSTSWISRLGDFFGQGSTYIHTSNNRLWSHLACSLGGNNRLWSPYGLRPSGAIMFHSIDALSGLYSYQRDI